MTTSLRSHPGDLLQPQPLLSTLLTSPWRLSAADKAAVAAVGNFGSSGRMDYTAIGRQVNLASRLQAGCAPGKIAISHPTWLLVRDQVACVAQGELSVKGIQQPVKVYEVAGEV